jgi:hypothetical protein
VAPILIGPSGAQTTNKPPFRWNPVAGATKYRLYVYKLTAPVGYVLTPYVLPAACTATTCTYTPTTTLAKASYKFMVETYNTTGKSGPSAWMNFTVP